MKLNIELNLVGMTVLVVEDDPTSLLLLKRVMEQHGAEVDCACDGGEAKGRLEQQKYALMITDINMPVMSGFELVRHIREYDKDMQIIATSANSDSESLIAAIELGFNEYIIKPIDINKLLVAVKRCVEAIIDKQHLLNEQLKFKAAVEHLGEGLVVRDINSNIVYQNQVAKRLFGDVSGQACYTMFGYGAPCGDCPEFKLKASGKPYTSQRKVRHNGSEKTVEVTASLLKNYCGEIIGSVGIIRDITERIQHLQRIHDLAFHDPLTGLANRRLFNDRLVQVFARARRKVQCFALLFIDLDNFKQINDNYGHEAGDVVLTTVARRICHCCRREADTVSRMGGDEFCVIIEDNNCENDIDQFCVVLHEQLLQPMDVLGVELQVGASIGYSVFPRDGDSIKELEMAADRAMYVVKKNSVCERVREKGRVALEF
ncbi:MAG: hypothetical protein B6I36_02545 [Desulfobacteraceae bacterium 4572_35.1]|nr:MAG: hypothetical protein B6I36_02545 [Desulfobacteraceae bacterium 4572_35.1]